MENQAIGKLKSSKTVYCTICSQSLNRKASVLIYSKEDLDKAKKELSFKLNKDYTCKICSSIVKSVK